MRHITCILLLLTIAVNASPRPAKTKPNPVAVSLEEYIRQAKASQPPAQASEGSLYSEGGTNSDLFSDVKARRIHDIVTIQVQENTTAENTADSQTNRKSSTALSVPNFFGVETHNPGIPFDKLVTANTDMSHKGDGTTKRTGLVSAYLSARVRDVLPNGNLVVEGIKEIKVNNERQVLSLFGVVRPQDIGPNNVVLSTAVADMMVQIDGKGIISDTLNPGWLFRFLTKIWPF
jgi:flagellar L-ring protein precursor FlgH